MFFCFLFAAHAGPPTKIDDPAGDFAAQRSPPAELPMKTLVRDQEPCNAASALVPSRDWRGEFAAAFKIDKEYDRLQKERIAHLERTLANVRRALLDSDVNQDDKS